MTEWAGDNQHYYICDNPECNKRLDAPILPKDWYFLALGQGDCLECAELVKDFCSKACLETWLFHNQGNFED